MHVEAWALIIGALLITMALAGSLLRRLPLSTGMLYLAAGVALGPSGLELMEPDPVAHAALLERVTEVAVLISLFAIGLKLGLPLSDGRWRMAIRLATVSMVATVALVAVIGHYALGLPLGAAVLLGAVLAPTDPVLASDVQVVDADDRDRLRYSLSAEGGAKADPETASQNPVRRRLSYDCSGAALGLCAPMLSWPRWPALKF